MSKLRKYKKFGGYYNACLKATNRRKDGIGVRKGRLNYNTNASAVYSFNEETARQTQKQCPKTGRGQTISKYQQQGKLQTHKQKANNVRNTRITIHKKARLGTVNQAGSH